MAKLADIGIYGVGVMGQNLALNMESKGFFVAVHNITRDLVDALLEGKGKGKNIIGTYSIGEFIAALERPRKILLMVTAGSAVDQCINALAPHLDKGDIIIDGGNSFFKDTLHRCEELEKKGILYIGTGISGGEEGALKGPSIMPGGAKEAWPSIAPIFQKIAAKVADGSPCCQWIGSGGSGHFVKMVHNGIEYGDMQLISEAYFILKNALNLSADALHRVFAEWNEGELNSYLIDITSRIFTKIDPDTGKPIVDIILDKAGQKGTGKWTSQIALDLGVAAPTIAEAVFARCISAIKNERVEASKVLAGPQTKYEGNQKALIDAVRQALYASKICSYAQGFAMMKEASNEYKWNLNFGSIALLWRNGCIIRAQFLERIKEAFDKNPGLTNLLLAPYFKEAAENSQKSWRLVLSTAINLGIPIPAFSSALCYYDSYRTETLPANLLQAQRDYFGAHTYERVDKAGSFHTEWL